MAKHNYSQYANKSKLTAELEPVKLDPIVRRPEVDGPIVEDLIVSETNPIVPVIPVIKPVVELKTVPGVVSGCSKLNVRVKPNATADVVCVINAATEVDIDEKKSNKDWYYVSTAAGNEGYCMRKYVKARL